MGNLIKIHKIPGLFFELPRDHVNAFIVETTSSVIVIDTTLALSSAKILRQYAEQLRKPITCVLLTHGHPDHYSGLVEFKDVPKFGSQGCLEFAHAEDIEKASTARAALGTDWPDVRDFPDQIVKDGEKIELGGLVFRFADLGPGESPSDGSWTFEDDGIKHSFIGDLVANNCHSFFRDGFVREWIQVLERLKKEFDQKTLMYIGHGNCAVSNEFLNWQIGYNETLINSISRLKGLDKITEDHEKQVLSDMKNYLPSEATLFLTEYELNKTLEIIRDKLL